MEGLAALLTVPNGAPLINRVRANRALLGPLGEGLNEVLALVSQVVVLVQEILEVVLHGHLVSAGLFLFFLNENELIGSLIWVVATGFVSEGCSS